MAKHFYNLTALIIIMFFLGDKTNTCLKSHLANKLTKELKNLISIY